MAGWSFLDEMKLNGMDWLKKISQNQSQTHTHTIVWLSTNQKLIEYN